MRTKITPPASSEWDFERLLKNLSEKEINVCYHYEFTREIPSISQELSAIRGYCRQFDDILGIASTDNRFFEDNPVLIDPKYHVFFLNYPESPNTPYLGINQAIREKRIKALLPDETSDEELAKRLQSPLGLENPNIWPEIKLVIPIYYTHQQLIEAFRAHLRLHFPDQGKAGKQHRGQLKIGKPQGGATEVRTQRNALRALGVYRLQKASVKVSEIEELMKNAKGKPLYHSESALNRAKALARKHIASCKKLAPPDGALDILPFVGFERPRQ